jgi:hypothetical protein
MAACLLAVPLLHACGGGGSDAGTGNVRVVNASDDYASLDVYSSTTLLTGAVATGTASAYSSVGAATYTLGLNAAGSSTTLTAADRAISKDTSFTLLAYSTSQALKSAIFTDNEGAPTAGTAKLRIFNASNEAGTLDVYVTAPSTALASTAATTASLAGERLGSYSQFSAGTYRIRVTAAGDQTDLRLDLPAVALADQQIATLVLTTSSSGVLVHGLLINQGAAVTPQRNTSARVRLVAGAGGSGTVTATANGTVLSSGLQSPAVGNYVLVNAGALTLTTQLNGVALTTGASTLAAGSDNTLLVTSNGGTGTATLLTDNNRPAVIATNARLQLVHGIGSLASPITLTADYSAVASDVPTNTASPPANVVPSTTMRLEATSAGSVTSLYVATDVTLLAGKVYTLFMLGDVNAPVGVLRRNR